MNNTIDINGVDVNYTRACSTDKPSETLIFLHGWQGTSKSWERNIEKLSSEFDCIAVDMPGFGITPEPSQVWGVSEYAEFIKYFASTLGLTKFTLVGKSFGGRVAIYFASKWPESLSHLILVSAAGIERKGIATQLRILIAKLGKTILQTLGDKNVRNLQQLLYRTAGINRDISDYKWEVKKLVTNISLEDEASKISVPTLIVWGINDQILPIKWGKELNKIIQNSSLKQISGGHNAHMQSAKEFNKQVENFLSNQ